jgi:hypothetical protein
LIRAVRARRAALLPAFFTRPDVLLLFLLAGVAVFLELLTAGLVGLVVFLLAGAGFFVFGAVFGILFSTGFWTTFFFDALAEAVPVFAVVELSVVCPATGIAISSSESKPARQRIAGRRVDVGEESNLISLL